MTDKVHRSVGRQLVENGIKICEVVWKPVAIRLPPVGQPIAAPIRRVDVPLFLERIDQELE
jgi:hypothetical protein